MSLQVVQSFAFPLNSDRFHEERKGIVPYGIYEGLVVSVGAIPMSLNVSKGTCIMPLGQKINNPEAVSDAVGLSSNNSGLPRYDVLVIEYHHGMDPVVNIPIFKIIEGDPGSGIPNIESDFQLPIAHVLLPPGASSLSNDMIHNYNPIPRVSDAGLIFNDISYDSGSDSFPITQRKIYRPVGSEDIHIDGNLSLELESFNISFVLLAIKLILEGSYWGNFDLEYNFDSTGNISKAIITLKDGSQPYPTVDVLFEYNIHNKITSQVFEIDGYRVTMSFNYDGTTLIGYSQNVEKV